MKRCRWTCWWTWWRREWRRGWGRRIGEGERLELLVGLAVGPRPADALPRLVHPSASFDIDVPDCPLEAYREHRPRNDGVSDALAPKRINSDSDPFAPVENGRSFALAPARQRIPPGLGPVLRNLPAARTNVVHELVSPAGSSA